MAKEVVFLTPPLGMAGTSGQFSTDPSQFLPRCCWDTWALPYGNTLGITKWSSGLAQNKMKETK